MLSLTTDPFTYGPYPEDAREDSDSDLTPACGCCEGPVDENGYCFDCQEYGS